MKIIVLLTNKQDSIQTQTKTRLTEVILQVKCSSQKYTETSRDIYAHYIQPPHNSSLLLSILPCNVVCMKNHHNRICVLCE